MGQIEELKKELAGLKAKKKSNQEIKKLKAQIRSHKFDTTRGGKVFNKIADIGDAGLKASVKFLGKPNPPQASGKKKKKKPVQSVADVMARLPQ